jgi:hypothetical protein
MSIDGDILTIDWIVNNVFIFEAGLDRKVRSQQLLFEPDGTISGYYHNNESHWRLSEGELLILRGDGEPSCRAHLKVGNDGVVELEGKFLFASNDIRHYFRPVAKRRHSAVQTFDLFDTLVARHCYAPLAIFDRVEAKARRPNFASLRRKVESELWSAGDYSFDDIYDRLAVASKWSVPEIEKLKMLELAEEWDNLFPIREMLARVQPDDMIVSDMYLPEAFLRRLVEEKCGLRGIGIHLSNHGKHHGTIWSKVQVGRQILRHHGDNYHSDVIQAQKMGIEAQHVTMFKWTRGEEVLNELGLREIAQVIRRERLESFIFDKLARKAQLAQLEVNLPVLVIASLLLIRYGISHGIDTVLMCGRDCNLWVELMRWITSLSDWRPAIHYFPSSRELFLRDSPAYAAYFDHLRGRSSLIVDLSGTGRTPAHFVGRIGAAREVSVFIALKSEVVSPSMEKLAPARSDVEVVSGIRADGERFDFEKLNFAIEGRATDMLFKDYCFHVIRTPTELTGRAAELVSVMHTTFDATMRRLREARLRTTPNVNDEERLRVALKVLAGDARRFAAVTDHMPG